MATNNHRRGGARPLGVVENPVTQLWQVSVRLYRDGSADATWSTLDVRTRRLHSMALDDPSPTLFGGVQLPEALLHAAQEVVRRCQLEEQLP